MSIIEHPPVAPAFVGDATARWRYEQFCRLGFSEMHAQLLAASSADLNGSRALVARGCPVGLAFAILA